MHSQDFLLGYDIAGLILQTKETFMTNWEKFKMNQVEIHIEQDGQTNKIKVPFGVSVTDDLKSEVKNIIK